MTNQIKNILKEYVNFLFKIIGQDIEQVILYGSYARGEQDLDGEISDIDIMILVNENDDEKLREIQKKILDYSYDFDLNYNILLSPIVESVENYKTRKKYMTFYQKVENEGVHFFSSFKANFFFKSCIISFVIYNNFCINIFIFRVFLEYSKAI